MGRNLLNPGCGICDDCDPCETPTRGVCQFRSGTNGETITTRPTIAINVVITPGTTAACGSCDFDEDYTATCPTAINDVLVVCNLTSPPRQRRLEVSISFAVDGSGFNVFIHEYVLGFSFKQVTYIYLFDDFAYTDCDDNPAVDEHGAATFTLDRIAVSEVINSDLCDFNYDVTATNN
jgi:hypothetical protein